MGNLLVVSGENVRNAAASLFREFGRNIVTVDEILATNPEHMHFVEDVVTVWPRNDAAEQRKAARAVSALIAGKVAMVRVVDVSSLPEGWDLGDAPPPGVDLRKLLYSAKGPSDDAEMARLAELDPVAYGRERIPASKRVGIPVEMLDRARTKKQREMEAAAAAATAAAEAPLPIVPWEKPVDGAALLDKIVVFIQRHVAFAQPEAEAVAAALWAMGTHMLAAFNIFPRLTATSAVPESGKTTLLEILELLVPRPDVRDVASAASIYESLDKEHPPTILLDEMDHLPRDKLLLHVINSGHRRGKSVTRYRKKYPTFAAMMLCLIGEPPVSITSRSIRLRMRPKRPDLKEEETAPFDKRNLTLIAQLNEYQRQLARWALDNVVAVKAKRPKIAGLSNRAHDNWAALGAVADQIGGDWSRRLRDAAKVIETRRPKGSDIRDLAIGVGLVLVDHDDDYFTGKELVKHLVEVGCEGWWLTVAGVGHLLNACDYYAEQKKIRRVNQRRYLRADLVDFSIRYNLRPKA
jgi:putative DNA primase/helicase